MSGIRNHLKLCTLLKEGTRDSFEWPLSAQNFQRFGRCSNKFCTYSKNSHFALSKYCYGNVLYLQKFSRYFEMYEKYFSFIISYRFGFGESVCHFHVVIPIYIYIFPLTFQKSRSFKCLNEFHLVTPQNNT